MGAQGGRLLGDGCFEHPGQNVKMDVFLEFLKYYTHCLISVIFKV